MRNEITLYRDDYKTIYIDGRAVDCFDEMLKSQFGLTEDEILNSHKFHDVNEVSINLSSGEITYN
tara:strand:+ start:76 stop:270 length:195 start_codon:yes stop_codon:yes gene_type:complete